jgi:hypothetical protein
MPEFWYIGGKMMDLEQVKAYKAQKEALNNVEPVSEVESPTVPVEDEQVVDTVPSLDDVLPVTSLFENEEEINGMTLQELRLYVKGIKFVGQPGKEKLIQLLTQK